MAKRARPKDLREACIAEAQRIVDKNGIENLSLREVARRLGVSHQAPYRHFPSRDHILAEIVSRAYTSFAEFLQNRPTNDDPDLDLGEMGKAYLEYARLHPLQYRLMFETPLPSPQKHPDMMRNAQYTFRLLFGGVAKLHESMYGDGPHRRTDFDALFIWFTLHGLSSAIQSHVMDTIELKPEVKNEMVQETFDRIGWMLASEENTQKIKQKLNKPRLSKQRKK